MKKYDVYQWISEKKSNEEYTNERVIRLERIVTQDMNEDFLKKADEKSPGISKMLQQMQKNLLTARFNTEEEAMAYIEKLEREEQPGDRKEYCIVIRP